MVNNSLGQKLLTSKKWCQLFFLIQYYTSELNEITAIKNLYIQI